MKVHIDYDYEQNKPIVCLEPENEAETLELELVASFDTASFRIILDEAEVSS